MRGGGGRVPQDGGGVGHRVGVVRQQGEVGPRRARLQLGQGKAVQLRATVRRDGVLDRQAGQLVPERHARCRAGRACRTRGLRRGGDAHPGQGGEHLQVGLRRHDGHRVEQQPRGAGSAATPGPARPRGRSRGSRRCPQRASRRRRTGSRRSGGRARRGRRRRAASVATASGDSGERVTRRTDRLVASSPTRVCRGWSRSSWSSRYVTTTSDGGGLHLAREQAEHVEGRLVGPVQVLEHQDGRVHRPELAQEALHHGVRRRVRGGELLELAAGRLRDVEQRTERARGEQRVAGSREDPGGGALRTARAPGSSCPRRPRRGRRRPTRGTCGGRRPAGR